MEAVKAAAAFADRQLDETASHHLAMMTHLHVFPFCCSCWLGLMPETVIMSQSRVSERLFHWAYFGTTAQRVGISYAVYLGSEEMAVVVC